MVIKVHATDNVAVAVDPGGSAYKVALVDIPEGEPVRRYGHVIGYAVRTIPEGARVSEDLVTLPEAPALETLPLATAIPAPLPALEGFTFEGFRNADGSAGTKNLLGITTTVQCVAPTVEFAVRRINAEILPRYPNVDGVIALTHPYGCGVAINAPGSEIPIRTIRNLSLNPNLGGESLVVSLGCEKLAALAAVPVSTSLRSCVFRMKNRLRGNRRRHHARGREADRTPEPALAAPCPASDLVVGLQCGGSDALSGVTANPAVGYAADLFVRAGATVMFSEVTEVRDAVHLLTPRAASVEVGRALIREMAWYDEYLRRGYADRSANPTPGNKRGGLANIVEKALGSVAKSGSTALNAVTAPGERVTTKGLVFAATPASDFICGTLQTAAGMNLHIFTTGEGTPYGLAVVPVIKVSSRTALAERWPDLIDIDAGRIAAGSATIEEVGWEIFHFALDVASGRKRTWADRWGLHNAPALFNPAPVT